MPTPGGGSFLLCDAVEEVIESNEGSAEDRRFDSIVGAMEEAVMNPTFATVQQGFLDEWCDEFDEGEENKLIFNDIFQRFTQLVEGHLDGCLQQRIPGFEMGEFMKMVNERKDEVVGDVFDMLMALGDFEEFKSMMLAHRAGQKRGITGVGSAGSCSSLGSGEHYGARPGRAAPTTGAALPPHAATSEGARRHEGKV